MKLRLALAAFTLAMAPACFVLGSAPDLSLAQARVSSDFTTYEIRRVGLLPFDGFQLTPERRRELQNAFHSEFSQSTPFEIVLLGESQLQELIQSDPYIKGTYEPRTIIGLSQRFNLDAIFFGTITQERFFPPQVLSMQLDLVAAETGMVVWSSTIHLNADDPRVAEGLQTYYGGIDKEVWQIAMLSPERFARFAAFQMACLL